MAVTGKTYNPAFLAMRTCDIDFESDDIRVMLVASGYTFDKDHAVLNDITNEVTNSQGTGYERKALANRSVTLVADDVIYDADNPQYTGINTNEELAAAIVYKHVTDDTDSIPIFYCEFLDSEGNAAPLPTNGSDVEARISDENGISKDTNILA